MLRRRITALILIGAITAFAAIAVVIKKRLAPSTVPTPVAAPGVPLVVDAKVVETESVAFRYEESGWLQAENTFDLGARVSGRVLDQKVRGGDIVQEGDLIVTLDKALKTQALLAAKASVQKAALAVEVAQEAVQSAEAQIETAQAQAAQMIEDRKALVAGSAEIQASYDNQVKEEARLKRLLEGGAVSRAEWEAASTQLETYRQQLVGSQADLESFDNKMKAAEISVKQSQVSRDKSVTDLGQANAMLEQARSEESSVQTQMDWLDFKSPVKGLIEKVFVGKNEYVTTGQTVARIAQIESLKVVIPIDPWVRDAIDLGLEVEVEIPDLEGVVLPGVVSLIGAEVDAQSHKVPMEVRVKNVIPESQKGLLPEGMKLPEAYPIRPGYHVRCRFTTRSARSTLRIRKNWTMSQFSETFVFVLSPVRGGAKHDGKPIYVLEKRRVEVQTPAFEYEVFEVKGGLKPGDQIVVSNHADLAPGSRVILK